MTEQKESAIEQDPKKCGGDPVIRGTRLQLWHLAEHVEYGYTFDEYADLYHVDKDIVARAYQEYTD